MTRALHRQRLPHWFWRGLVGLLILTQALAWGAFGFARWGGTWASRTLLPAPPDSQAYHRNVLDGQRVGYRDEVTVYVLDLPIVPARDWFHRYLVMEPSCVIPPCAPPDPNADLFRSVHVYGRAYRTLPYDLHSALVRLYGGVADVARATRHDCFSVIVFSGRGYGRSVYGRLYPLTEAQIGDGVVAVVRRCWAHMANH